MAIALDTAGGTYSRTASQTTSNFTFNNAAGTFLVCGFALNSNSDLVTSVTYNSVAMSFAVKQLGNSEYGYMYYLVNPATGSNTLTVTRSANSVCDIGIASYSGVDTASPIDLTTSTTVPSGSSSITETITSTVDNCWMVAFSGLQRATTASTNSTQRSGVTIGGNLYDSNGAITPAGSFSMTQNITSTGPATGVAMTFKPASTTAVKTVNGVTRASVKTMDGVASANIKTINGVT